MRGISQTSSVPPPPPERGGIYIASNVPDSTRLWKCKITNDEIIGKNGNIEPMREFLPSQGMLLKPGQVYWMSDRTPHESLPMKKTTLRQFFRIMTSEVEFWFKDHYTANPMGVLPDPHVTEIVVGKELSEEFQILQDWKEAGYGQMRMEKERLQEVERRRRDMIFNCVVDGAYCDFRRSSSSASTPTTDSESESDVWSSDEQYPTNQIQSQNIE